VDVCLALMLLVGILVRLVGVGQGGVIVFVVMAGGEVGPLLPMSQVVGHVGVLVLVHLGLVVMLLCCHGRLRSFLNRDELHADLCTRRSCLRWARSYIPRRQRRPERMLAMSATSQANCGGMQAFLPG
jgi:hypothetical protein